VYENAPLASPSHLLLSVDKIQRRYGDHANLRALLYGEILGIVRPIEVLT